MNIFVSKWKYALHSGSEHMLSGQQAVGLSIFQLGMGIYFGLNSFIFPLSVPFFKAGLEFFEILPLK